MPRATSSSFKTPISNTIRRTTPSCCILCSRGKRMSCSAPVSSRRNSAGSCTSGIRWDNRLLTLLSNMATNLNLTDMETCYKVFRRELIQSIVLEEDRFGFEPEITSKMAKAGARVLRSGHFVPRPNLRRGQEDRREGRFPGVVVHREVPSETAQEEVGLLPRTAAALTLALSAALAGSPRNRTQRRRKSAKS